MSVDRAWQMDFYVVNHVNSHWATVGVWYGPWSPDDDDADALCAYLENSRLPDGRYRVIVSSASANTGTEIDFRRTTPMPPGKPLRTGWHRDYST